MNLEQVVKNPVVDFVKLELGNFVEVGGNLVVLQLGLRPLLTLPWPQPDCDFYS